MLKLLLCSFCFLSLSLFIYIFLVPSLDRKEKEVKSDDEKDIILKQSVMIITVSLYMDCTDNHEKDIMLKQSVMITVSLYMDCTDSHGFGKMMLDVCR